MGTWGTAISSNDTYEDVFDTFFGYYNQKQSLAEILLKLEKEFTETISDPDDALNYYFALAKAEWECGLLDKKLLQIVDDSITSGAALDSWKTLNSSSSDLKKREKALTLLQEKLHSVNANPKKPKQPKLYDSIFQKGDCIIVNLHNGFFGGALVLESETASRTGENVFAVTDYYSSKPPTPSDILKANCLPVYNSDKPEVANQIQFSVGEYAFKKSEYVFTKIGQIAVRGKYTDQMRMTFGSWNHIGERIVQYKNDNQVKAKLVSVQKYIKKSWFSF